MSVFGKTYNTRAELGRAIQEARPSLAARDPVELADAFLSGKYGDRVTVLNNVKGYGDISASETLSNLPGSVMKVGSETVAGIADMLTSPYQTASNLVSVGRGLGENVSRAIGLPIDIATKPDEQAAQAMVDQFKNSLSPEGIQTNPAEAAANIASVLSPRAALKALGAAKAGGQAAGAAAKAAKAARVASRVAESAPISNTLGVAYDAAKAGGRAARRTYRDFESSAAMKGGSGNLVGDLTSSALGFMSGVGPKAQAWFEQTVLRDPKKWTAFVDAMNEMDPGSTASGRAVKETTRQVALGIQKEHHAERAALMDAKAKDPGLDMTVADVAKSTPVNVADVARSELSRRLGDYGVRIERVKTDFIDPATLPRGKFEVVFDERRYPQVYGDNGPTGHYGRVARPAHTGPNVTSRTVMVPGIDGNMTPYTTTSTSLHAYEPPRRLQGNLSTIQQEVEDVANIDKRVTLRDLDDRRQRLDQIVDQMPNAPDGTPTPEKRMAMAVRMSLGDAIRAAADQVAPGYGAALTRYQDHLVKLGEMRDVFHIGHDALDRNGEFLTGKTNFQSAGSAIYNAFSQTEGNFSRIDHLDRISRYIPDGDKLIPRILAGQYKDYIGGTLTGRAETAGGARRAGTAAAGIGASLLLGTGIGMGTASVMAGALGTVLSGATMSMLYSPRLSAHLQHRISRYVNKPPNPGKIRRAASAMFDGAQRLRNDVRSRPYVMAALSEGWSVAKTFQRMQEEGVPVEQILNPPKQQGPSTEKSNDTARRQRGLVGTLSKAGRM